MEKNLEKMFIRENYGGNESNSFYSFEAVMVTGRVVAS